MNTIHFRSFNLSELQLFLESLEIPKYRASQILDWLHQKHVMNFSEMKNLPKALKETLAQCAAVQALTLVEVPESKNHESSKYLMKTEDGHLLESVLIAQSGRQTVCVSTQLGCRVRCSFCASGKGKFGRNLTAGEIVEQVSQISRHLSVIARSAATKQSTSEITSFPSVTRNDITNVVFMGMGEPLDNYEATMKAIEILTSDWGFGLGGRRITVSTSGITPMIEKFVHDSRGRVRLSVSLHSSDQETRSQLVPINKKYRLDDLIQMLEKIHRVLRREITFEYTLIEGINDSLREARGVGKIASRLGAKVNLIPYNPIREMDYHTPSEERIAFFRKFLEEKDVHVTVRQTAGRDIDAACGQLRLDRKS